MSYVIFHSVLLQSSGNHVVQHICFSAKRHIESLAVRNKKDEVEEVQQQNFQEGSSSCQVVPLHMKNRLKVKHSDSNSDKYFVLLARYQAKVSNSLLK